MKESFTADELKTCAEAEVVKFTSYYSDFLHEYQKLAPANAPTMAAGTFVDEVTDNGNTLSIRATFFGSATTLTVEKQEGLDVRPQDGVQFTFNMATGALDKENGAAFYRDGKPTATAKLKI